MLQKSARLQYALLAVVAAFAFAHFYLGTVKNFDNLAHGHQRARAPFFLGSLGHAVRLTTPEAIDAGRKPGDTALTVTHSNPEAKAAGLQNGDAVLAINGHPFFGGEVLLDELNASHPGGPMSLTILRPDESEAHITLILAPERSNPPPIWAWVLQWSFLVLPFLCLLIGLYTVFARPTNPHAWLILGILIFFDAAFFQTDQVAGLLALIISLWAILAQTSMFICLMLFGIYFPERSTFDVRVPWLKWFLIIPILLLLPFDFLATYGHRYNFNADAAIDPWAVKISNVSAILGMLAISYFFAAIGRKMATASGDARRRLKILYVGAAISLTPLFILVLIAVVRSKDVGQGIPQWITLTTFMLLLLFPLTLAYVVIVHRAVDVSILIRQGTRYFFARQSVWIIRIALAAWFFSAFIRLLFDPARRTPGHILELFAIFALFYSFRHFWSARLQQTIDRRFFREAYSTEQLLAELSDQARNFTEVAPLIDTVTRRLGSTLHIDRIAVFLRSGETFHLQLTTGTPLSPGLAGSFILPATSTTITTLARTKAPANVYQNDPSSWLVDATDAERTALADLSTELLVPLPGRNRLAGVIALGPKRSEQPYSKADRQMLQSVASQTGLALENAELLENLTSEVAQRERISREIEIAREVQERLFPQSYPHIPGLDLAGFCRPAQAVGGDYYDFFPLSDARLALALGDISGKGISAALLMASLRASLRSIAGLQLGDLASLISHVNNLVYESSTTNRYATFFYAEYDPFTRLLTYVNAGHNPPYVLRGTQAIPLEATGTVIGLLPGAVYAQATIPMHPGDVLLVFTDGISEAMSNDDEEWGEDRMLATAQQLLAKPDCTARQILSRIVEAADTFTAGAPQHDDMTLLICTIS